LQGWRFKPILQGWPDKIILRGYLFKSISQDQFFKLPYKAGIQNYLTKLVAQKAVTYLTIQSTVHPTFESSLG
jgi:hypothetical protein